MRFEVYYTRKPPMFLHCETIPVIRFLKLYTNANFRAINGGRSGFYVVQEVQKEKLDEHGAC